MNIAILIRYIGQSLNEIGINGYVIGIFVLIVYCNVRFEISS